MASQDTPIDSLPVSGYATPRSSYNGIHFTPRRAVASFENLVALANYQERLKEARKMVWRDKGQPVSEVQDLWECLEHAGWGGLRAGALAFNIRASVSLVLAFIRMRNVPRHAKNVQAFIRHAVFGLDTIRFAAMLGAFVSIYKFLINSLPLLFPSINPRSSLSHSLAYPRHDPEVGLSEDRPRTTFEVPLAERRARLSLTTQAHLILIRKKTRRWHAALAGAIAGGLAIMFEKRSRRTLIGQQMFVRGLQGSWNSFATKRNIRIPHGDILVFSFACGQIMYGFLLRPDTLPRSYSTWIGQASKVPLECVKINHDLVRDGKLNLSDLNDVLSRKDITPHNYAELMAVKDLALSSLGYQRRYVPCPAVHPWIDSCMLVPFDRFVAVFKWMLPIYGTLHLIPAVLFKRAAFFENPMKMLLKAAWGTTRSSAFLGVFVIIYQGVFCFKHNLHAFLSSGRTALKLPRFLVDILISKPSFWFTGILTGLSLFVEEKRRRGELAMYVLPKGLESAWVMARGKGLVFETGQYGEVILTAIAMGMVMSIYQNDPQHLSGLVRRILYQFIGPN